VNGAENARQQSCIGRMLLKFHQLLIQAREVFITLDQKFLNHILILHALSLHKLEKVLPLFV
jgi:hypothetical protein